VNLQRLTDKCTEKLTPDTSIDGSAFRTDLSTPLLNCLFGIRGGINRAGHRIHCAAKEALFFRYKRHYCVADNKDKQHSKPITSQECVFVAKVLVSARMHFRKELTSIPSSA
jgi:hypothetical protein